MKRHEPIDRKALAQYGCEREDLEGILGQERGACQNRAPNRERQLARFIAGTALEGALDELLGKKRIALTASRNVADRRGVERLCVG